MESPLVSSAQMRAAEERAFARGITAETLMDDAAAGIARAVCRFFPIPGRCLVYAGKGNNGGDACAAAERLHACGWQIDLRLAFAEEDCGELARKKIRKLRGAVASAPNLRTARSPVLVLDGLLGLGGTPPLREPIRGACREINRLRRDEGAYVFAIDLPSGLNGDTGAVDEDCIVADFTVSIGYAKRGLCADGALDFVGRIERVSLPPLHENIPAAEAFLADAESLRHLLPRRKFGAYKNQFGRVGILAGSRGLSGAAVLCATGALRGGAGLVELFVAEEIYAIVAPAAPPEVMVKAVGSYDQLIGQSVDVWAVGPGLGQSAPDELRRFIRSAEQPMVLDADALTIVAEDPQSLTQSAGPRLLTPHPGEMKRLYNAEGMLRADIAAHFTAQHAVTLLLKGSRTIVSTKGKPLSYNSTGNPGMATGGMGDVLTGVCAALIGQRVSLHDSARVGAWVCGRAAELAIFNGIASEQSLLPSDVIANLGRAFRELTGSD